MSNYKKRPRPKPPTWKSINSKECVKTADQRKVNTELKKHLQKLGWTMWDSCNIWEQGYTISAKKVMPELVSHRNPYLFFSWHWDNQGGPNFWEGRIYGFYDYEPEYKYMRPSGMFEIRNIINRNKHQIDQMEKRVVAALLSQTKLV